MLRFARVIAGMVNVVGGIWLGLLLLPAPPTRVVLMVTATHGSRPIYPVAVHLQPALNAQVVEGRIYVNQSQGH